MRIVVSSDSEMGLLSSVSHHFGRCPFFTIVDVEDGVIKRTRVVENPFFQSHSPGQVPSFIRKLGAEAMIAGGMGRRAIAMFEDFGIGCATGASGSVESAVGRFVSGSLSQAAPCRESVMHAGGEKQLYEKEPASRVMEEAEALLREVDDVIVRLPDEGEEGKEEKK